MSQMTPEELDEIYNIKDPDPRAGVSPKGCHYSKNHIDYLMNQGYTLDAAKRELNLTSTYCAPDASIVEDKSSSSTSSSTTVTTTSTTNQEKASATAKTEEESKSKVKGVTGTSTTVTKSTTEETIGTPIVENLDPPIRIDNGKYLALATCLSPYKYKEKIEVYHVSVRIIETETAVIQFAATFEQKRGGPLQVKTKGLKYEKCNSWEQLKKKIKMADVPDKMYQAAYEAAIKIISINT